MIQNSKTNHPDLSFSLADLMNTFEMRCLQKGKDYQRKNKVNQLSISPNGAYITSTVTGKVESSYDVEIHLEKIDGTLMFEGGCSCYVGYNCKHVAATLIEVLVHQLLPKHDNKTPFKALADLSPWEHFLNSLHTESLVKSHSGSDAKSLKKEKLIYILNIRSEDETATLIVLPQIAYIKKDNSLGKLKNVTLSSRNYKSIASPDDERIMHHLEVLNKGAQYSYWARDYSLKGIMTEPVLKDMIETNRCYWENEHNPITEFGEAQKGQFVWVEQDGGLQALKCQLSSEAFVALPVLPLLYRSQDCTTLGPIHTEVNDSFAAKLMSAPLLEPSEAQKISKALNKEFKHLNIPQPKIYHKAPVKKVKMIPELVLTSKLVSKRRGHYGQPNLPVKAPVAFLSFKYGEHRIFSERADEMIDYVEENKLITIQRNESQERKALALIGLTNMSPLHLRSGAVASDESGLAFIIGDLDNVESHLDFMRDHLPRLKSEGFEVTTLDDFPYNFVEQDDWYTQIESESTSNWFDFELGVTIDGKQVNLLPVLIKYIREHPDSMTPIRVNSLPDDHKFYLQLEDNKCLIVLAKHIKPIVSVLIELFDYQPDLNKLQLTKLQVGQITELQEHLDARWIGDEKLKLLGKRLQSFKKIEAQPIPKTFKGSLRPYQQLGLDWLCFLNKYQLGGILADDMGLGKTVQIIALLLAKKLKKANHKPSLIIAPTSVIPNWANECKKFAPSLKVVILQGKDRHTQFDTIENADIVLSTYPLIVRDEETFQAHDFNYLILDEAQNVKNPRTKTYRALLKLQFDHPLALSGTPMENHLGELWSLFNFSLPGLLGDEKSFKRLFRDPIEKENDINRKKSLAQRIEPFLLRRTKEEVVTELPEKTEITQIIEIKGAQRELYEGIRFAMEHKVLQAIATKGLSKSHIVILDALLKLRQTCNDPRLVSLKQATKVAQSAKLEHLMEMLPTLVEQGRRILLFSSFTTMLSLIETELVKLGIPFVKLTGQTKDRATPINQFQQGTIPIMLLSLKAGGTGLNLTAADTVIHYDPWWNPAAEAQATDRAHRIGQTKPIFVYKLICKGTVEEKIIDMQNKKRDIMTGLFEHQEGKATKLTALDLQGLFAL